MTCTDLGIVRLVGEKLPWAPLTVFCFANLPAPMMLHPLTLLARRLSPFPPTSSDGIRPPPSRLDSALDVL